MLSKLHHALLDGLTGSQTEGGGAAPTDAAPAPPSCRRRRYTGNLEQGGGRAGAGAANSTPTRLKKLIREVAAVSYIFPRSVTAEIFRSAAKVAMFNGDASRRRRQDGVAAPNALYSTNFVLTLFAVFARLDFLFLAF